MILLTDLDRDTLALMHQHVIWDWNGTLLDDTALIADIVDGILSRRGVAPIGHHGYRQRFCHPAQKFYELCGVDLNKHSFHDLVEEFHAAYSARFREARLHGDTLAALNHFRGLGISQHILSAHLHDSLEVNVKHFEVQSYFKHVIGLDDGFARSKVGNGHLLMERSGANLENTVLIGDSTHDAEVAAAIGVPSLLVCRGIESRERLEPNGRPIFDSLAEALKYLESTPLL